MGIASSLQLLPSWFALGAGGGGGFFAIKWLFEWVAGRLDRREAHLDASTAKLIQGLEHRLKSVTDRLDEVERLLRECQKMHATSEAQVLRLEAIIQGQGEMRQAAAGVVALDRLSDMKEVEK